jgi:Peptidase propeptide and YPEB domain
MKSRKRLLVLGAAVAALAVAGGAGIAQAVSGDDEQVTGTAAERAADAALAAAGGGTVLEVERQDGDGAGVYEVEVRRGDGSEVEIHLDAQFREVGSAVDDDNGRESENDGSDD